VIGVKPVLPWTTKPFLAECCSPVLVIELQMLSLAKNLPWLRLFGCAHKFTQMALQSVRDSAAAIAGE